MAGCVVRVPCKSEVKSASKVGCWPWGGLACCIHAYVLRCRRLLASHTITQEFHNNISIELGTILCSPVNAILPNPRTIDGYIPSVKTGQELYI